LSDQISRDQYNKQKEDSVIMHLKTALPLEKYTGEYQNDVYGKMTVLLQNNELHMKFSHHAFDVTLGPLGGNRFYAVFSDPEFETAVFPFNVEEGKVKSVTVKVADFIEYTPYIFTKQDKN
jgi:hypothetical protein